jgi:transposase InsO family protein
LYEHSALVAPTHRNERWSMDFMSDTLASGRTLRTLNVVDDFTRECLAIEVDTSLSGRRVTRVLERLLQRRGRPGPEKLALLLDQKWGAVHISLGHYTYLTTSWGRPLRDREKRFEFPGTLAYRQEGKWD